MSTGDDGSGLKSKLSELSRFRGRDFFDQDFGSYSYRKQSRLLCDSRILLDSPLSQTVCVEIKGEGCRALGYDGCYQWLEHVYEHGKVTRLDLALDDYEKQITPAQLIAAAQTPDIITRARKGRTVQEFTPGEPAPENGQTFYLGTRGSNRMLRVYDKAVESGGKVDAIRWEFQYKDDYAQSLLADLITIDMEGRRVPWGETFRSHLASYLDFRDANSHSEPEKRRQCEWYAEFLGTVSKALIVLPEKIRSFERSMEWLDRQVAPTLAAIRETFAFSYRGSELLRRFDDALHAEGLPRVKPWQRAMAEDGVPEEYRLKWAS